MKIEGLITRTTERLGVETVYAQLHLPPLKGDDMHMGDMLYSSGTLDKTTK